MILNNNFSFAHQSLDAFPLTWTKIRTVQDLLVNNANNDDINDAGDNYEMSENPTKGALLWDFIVYHSRWNELSERDFVPEINLEKGASSKHFVHPMEFVEAKSDDIIEKNTLGEQYLRRLIEECKSRDIKVVLTFIPYPASSGEQMKAEYLNKIAQEYDVDYLNFFDLDIINYGTDFFDDNHLNSSGARKVTDYIGRYLSTQMGVTNHKDDMNYSFWYTDYDEYVNMKNNDFKDQQTLDSYLMLMTMDDCEAEIDIKNTDIFKDPDGMMDNITKVTNHLAEIGKRTYKVLAYKKP